MLYAGTVRESNGGVGSQSGSGWQGSDSDSDDDDKWNHKKRGTRTLGGLEPPSRKAGAWEGKSAGVCVCVCVFVFVCVCERE
jgi:hypothetical protein